MPEGTSIDGRLVCLPPVAIPTLATPSHGDWRHRGLCAGEDPEIFFPANGVSEIKARKICTKCPVSEDCLEYATEAYEFGIWGGLDQQQRRARRRRQLRQTIHARRGAESRAEESA
jgi:WhiB family transcriptional regulator, redox-sensing transcriptional regulator